MTRLGRLPEPPLAPGACLSCGNHTDPQGFFDLGQQIELWGACYLCATCVVFMAKALHMVGPDVIHNARQEAAEQRHRAATAAAEAARLELALGSELLPVIAKVISHMSLEVVGEPDGAAAAGSTDGSGPARPRRRRDGRSKPTVTGDGEIPGPDAGDFGTPSGPLPEPAAGPKP